MIVGLPILGDLAATICHAASSDQNQTTKLVWACHWRHSISCWNYQWQLKQYDENGANQMVTHHKKPPRLWTLKTISWNQHVILQRNKHANMYADRNMQCHFWCKIWWHSPELFCQRLCSITETYLHWRVRIFVMGPYVNYDSKLL